MRAAVSSGRLFAVALAAFVSLGLPDGVLGVAWPSMRQTFALPVSQLGVLLAASTAGYLASSFGSGPIVVRLGVGRLLLWSSVVMVVSLSIYALAPVWPVMVAGGVLAGLGAGAIDAGINAFAASSCSPQRTAWLHASYGVGAMLGPLVMTATLVSGRSWRWGYASIGLALAGMVVAFALTLPWWPRAVTADAESGTLPRLFDTLRRPRVLLHVALFFLYTGLEATAGQWTYSLVTEARGVSPAIAGIWTALFWGSLTFGRIVAAGLVRRASVDTVLRASTLLAPLAAVLVWLDAGGLATMTGMIGLGLLFAPVYPLLISATPARLGAACAPHAIGAQVAAAYLGVAALPGAVGVLARAYGLEVVGPLLTVFALGLLGLHEFVLRARTAA